VAFEPVLYIMLDHIVCTTNIALKIQYGCILQMESEYSLASMISEGKLPKADPAQFELLKVLGQGSFGKVS